MDKMVPVIKYVGGEDYEVIDRWIKPHEATPAQIRRALNTGFDANYEARIYTQPGEGPGAFLRVRRQLEREHQREIRRLWLHLKRKGG